MENTLAETEARYGAILASHQNTINMLEEEMGKLRLQIEDQGREYQMLLDVKTRLEHEINTYRVLLETESSMYVSRKIYLKSRFSLK